MMSVLDLRLALKAAGFSPIPCTGKRPTLPQWQNKIEASAEEMATWAGANTGIITGVTTAFDVDITNPEAADAVESIVRDWFDGKGVLPVRFGNAPKRAMLFRTSQPFSKMSVSFVDPRGAAHKIEILGDGQQLSLPAHTRTHTCPIRGTGRAPGP
jgi:Casjensviridae DNA primase